MKLFAHKVRAFLLSGMLFSIHGHGAQPQLNIDSVMDVYPNARVLEQSESEVQNYLLGLGEMRKIRGVWAPEKELREAGDLQRITMQLPEGHSARDAYEFYRKRFANIEARALFLCEARNCGPSNSWANEVFRIKELYGLDQDQFYGIFEVINDDDEINYLTVYTVTRGNRRVMAHIERLSTSSVSARSVAPSPRAVLLQIQEQGYYVVSGLSLAAPVDDESQRAGKRIAIQPEHLKALVDAMRLDAQMSVRIVGHSYSGRDLEQQIADSKAMAEQLMAELKEAGVKADRLEAHGVGSLAPARQASSTQNPDFRIELLPLRSARFSR